jgi:hypothetical protein
MRLPRKALSAMRAFLLMQRGRTQTCPRMSRCSPQFVAFAHAIPTELNEHHSVPANILCWSLKRTESLCLRPHLRGRGTPSHSLPI